MTLGSLNFGSWVPSSHCSWGHNAHLLKVLVPLWGEEFPFYPCASLLQVQVGLCKSNALTLVEQEELRREEEKNSPTHQCRWALGEMNPFREFLECYFVWEIFSVHLGWVSSGSFSFPLSPLLFFISYFLLLSVKALSCFLFPEHFYFCKWNVTGIWPYLLICLFSHCSQTLLVW